MTMPQGIYFRATDNQSDPTNWDAEIAATQNYPRPSAQGNSVGYEDNWFGQTDKRDRDVGSVVQLKGCHFLPNTAGGPNVYRITLPATGDYIIRLALGDETQSTNNRCRLFDNTTQFADIMQGTSAAAEFVDATGVVRTSQADWVSNNASISRTFASTIFRIKMGESTLSGGGGGSAIAAVYIEAAGGGGGGYPILMGQACL